MIINLTGQDELSRVIAPHISTLKSLMEQREDVWKRASIEKKQKWLKSGKDPVMTQAWQIYSHLRDNFFGEINDI